MEVFLDEFANRQMRYRRVKTVVAVSTVRGISWHKSGDVSPVEE
jgi:hypothetical protein